MFFNPFFVLAVLAFVALEAVLFINWREKKRTSAFKEEEWRKIKCNPIKSFGYFFVAELWVIVWPMRMVYRFSVWICEGGSAFIAKCRSLFSRNGKTDQAAKTPQRAETARIPGSNGSNEETIKCNVPIAARGPVPIPHDVTAAVNAAEETRREEDEPESEPATPPMAAAPAASQTAAAPQTDTAEAQAPSAASPASPAIDEDTDVLVYEEGDPRIESAKHFGRKYRVVPAGTKVEAPEAKAEEQTISPRDVKKLDLQEISSRAATRANHSAPTSATPAPRTPARATPAAATSAPAAE
ncbi:MAG TPA: hypothetical protein VMD74_04970, partial [Candidatus Methylomirabilis sp.]|nr:hypothetical protein [Candidatus Methylomirabilis sp.]